MTSAPPSMKTSMPIARTDSTDECRVLVEANSAISDPSGSSSSVSLSEQQRRNCGAERDQHDDALDHRDAPDGEDGEQHD